MGTEKEERHGNDHDHHHVKSMAASTDMADIIAENEAEKRASAHQRKGKGPEAEFGKGAKSDIHGRILRYQVVGGQTEILFGAGSEQGVRADMGGYVKAGDNMLCEFKVSQVEAGTTTAIVDVSTRAITEVSDVVVNPSSKPAAGENMESRVIGVQISGDYVDIMIGRGAAHGVRKGMKGFLHSDDKAESYADFTISEVRATVSHAFVKLPNLDVLHQHDRVTLNPASHPKAKQQKH
jgi:hypothetical protein